MAGFRSVDPSENDEQYKNGKPFDRKKVVSLVPPQEEGSVDLSHVLYRPDDPNYRTKYGAKGTADEPTKSMPTEDVEEGAEFGPGTSDAKVPPKDEGEKPPKSLVTDAEMAHRPGAAEDWQDAKNPRPVAVKKRALARISKPAATQGMTPDAPESKTYDPLADLDARNAKDAAELKAAQDAAHEARRRAEGSNMIWRGFASATGTPINKEMEQSRLQDADQPLGDLEQRRQMEDQNMSRVGKRYDLSQDLRQDDPNDPLARHAAALAVARGMMSPADAKGFTLRTWKFMDQGASFQQAREKAAQESRDKAAERAVQMRGQDLALAGHLATVKGAEGDVKSGRAATIGKQLAQLRAAQSQIIDQANRASDTSVFAGLVAKIPGIGQWLAPQAAATEAGAKLLTGTVAGAAEGGVPSAGRMETTKPAADMTGVTGRAAIHAKRDYLLGVLRDREMELRNEAHGMGLRIGPGGELLDYGLPGAAGGTIRVREKASGQTGTLPAGEYDPSKYDRI